MQIPKIFRTFARKFAKVMSTAIYHIDEMPFTDWLQQHQDAQGIALVGRVQSDKLHDYDALTATQGKTLDISQLSIDFEEKYRIEAESQSETDLIWEYYYQHCCEEGNKTLPILLILCANRSFAQRFIVTPEYILSKDQHTIAFIIQPERNMVIEDGIINIGKYACMHREIIDSITFPESLQIISNNAFEKCTGLKEVHFPQTMQSLGDYAFGSTSIFEVCLPEGITTIPCGCFEYCWLIDYNIPSTVKIIEETGLGSPSGKEVVIIPEGVEDIQTNTFRGVRKIHFPSTLKKLDEYFYCAYQIEGEEDVPYITVHPDNPCFYATEGVLYRQGGTKPYIPAP